MKKVPKSLKAVVITFIVGMLVPKLFDITGIALIDKVIWKILLSLAFNLATIIVGFLFSAKLIRNKVDGGKARISIYLLIVIIILCSTTSVLIFFKEVAKIVLIVIGMITFIVISVLILNYIFSIIDTKNKFKQTQIKTTYDHKNTNLITLVELNSKGNHLNNDNKSLSDPLIVNESSSKKETPIELKTILELWQEFDHSQKCLIITDEENPELKWVKIYKGPYPNGKFYGYVLMQNARNTVNGEIYNADRPSWRIYKE